MEQIKLVKLHPVFFKFANHFPNTWAAWDYIYCEASSSVNLKQQQ